MSKGISVRVYDAEGRASSTDFSFSFPLSSVRAVDLLGKCEFPVEVLRSSFSTRIEPFSVETYEVRPAESVHARDGSYSPPCEVVQPVHSRYWEHNVGPAPIGYQSVSVFAECSRAGVISVVRGSATEKITVGIVNNYVDRAISGTLVICPPWGCWSKPEMIRYSLNPLSWKSWEVLLIFPGPNPKGIFRVRTEHDGQIYEDVIVFEDTGKGGS